jgi:hypothetical protein
MQAEGLLVVAAAATSAEAELTAQESERKGLRQIALDLDRLLTKEDSLAEPPQLAADPYLPSADPFAPRPFAHDLILHLDAGPQPSLWQQLESLAEGHPWLLAGLPLVAYRPPLSVDLDAFVPHQAPPLSNALIRSIMYSAGPDPSDKLPGIHPTIYSIGCTTLPLFDATFN